MNVFCVEMMNEFDAPNMECAMEALKMEARGKKPLPALPLPKHCFAEHIKSGEYEFRHIRAISSRNDETFGRMISRLDLHCEEIAA